jgi:chromosome segregation ATPase
LSNEALRSSTDNAENLKRSLADKQELAARSLTALQQQIDDLKAELGNRTRRFEDADGKRTELEKQNALLAAAKDQANERATTAEGKFLQIATQRAQLEGQMSQLGAELNRALAANKELSAGKGSVDAAVHSLREENSALKQSNAALQAQDEKLRDTKRVVLVRRLSSLPEVFVSN